MLLVRNVMTEDVKTVSPEMDAFDAAGDVTSTKTFSLKLEVVFVTTAWNTAGDVFHPAPSRIAV